MKTRTPKYGIEERDKSLAFSFKQKIANLPNGFQVKALCILAAFILIVSNIHISFSMDTSGWLGSVLDPIIEGGAEYSSNVASELADTLIQLLSLSFSPNFFTLMGTESPTAIYGTATKQMVKESYFFSTVFGLGQMLGVIIATILFFVNAFMFIIGNGDKIRDNPIVLFIRYIVSMTLVFIAFDVVYSVIMTIDEIWSQFVFRGYTSIYAGQSFYQTEVSRVFSQDPDTGKIIVWGAQLNVGMNGIWRSVVSCCGILILWKLIKSVFRLYMEVAERYFVLMVLCAFFPVAASTFTCATTKNIFFSYLRMFFCQAFVMLANIAFMKFFLYVLFSGGWLATLTNYICALAFVRVAQRLDSYMMAMGLNVAQTGAGILGAIGGAGMGFANMFRGANNTRKNLGKSLIGMGVAENDLSMFKAGAITGLSGETMIRGLMPTDTSFENSISRYNGVNSQGFTASRDAGYASANNTAAKDSWLRSTLKTNGVPTNDIDKLQDLGIDPNSIIQVGRDQRTGAVTYSDEKGALATSYKGDMFYNPMRDEEMDYNTKQAEISNKYNTEIEPGQTMSEADAARISDGMNDLNSNVSHVNLDTLKSLYGSDYDSLEAVPASRAEQSEMLNSGNDDVGAKPYGTDSVGHSRIQFRGRYTDQLQPKTDDFYVDMYNVAQHPDTLKNQGLAGWHFVKQGNEGFMVHDDRHTADDRTSVVGKTSPHYQKAKPNLNNPDNHIEAEKPSANSPGGKKGDGKDTSHTSTPVTEIPDMSSTSSPIGASPEPAAFSTFAESTISSQAPAITYESTVVESVDEAYERIYGSGQSSYEPVEKNRSKGQERRESSKRDRDRANRDTQDRIRNPKNGKGNGKSSRRGPSHKNIPADFDDDY